MATLDDLKEETYEKMSMDELLQVVRSSREERREIKTKAIVDKKNPKKRKKDKFSEASKLTPEEAEALLKLISGGK